MPTTVTKTVKSAGGDYTSLSAWEAGQQADITVSDTIQKAVCYAFQDTSAVVISGWTTDSTRYPWVTVNPADRHAGVPDTSKYYIKPTSAGYTVLSLAQPYVRVDGLQIVNNVDDNNLRGINLDSAMVAYVDGCLIGRTAGTFTFANDSYGIYFGVDRSQNGYVTNCLVYNWDFGAGKSNTTGIKLVNGAGPPGKAYVYGCTVTGVTNGTGYSDGFNDMVVRNCIAHNCSTGFGSGFDTNSSNNASSLADAPGTNNRNSQTFTFVNSGSNNFHLTSADTGAKGFGLDQSADSFFAYTNDVDNDTRTNPWSIGFDNGPAITAKCRRSNAVGGFGRTGSRGVSVV